MLLLFGDIKSADVKTIMVGTGILVETVEYYTIGGGGGGSNPAPKRFGSRNPNSFQMNTGAGSCLCLPGGKTRLKKALKQIP